MSKPTFRLDPKARGVNKRMLRTFGDLLKEQGWNEIKGRKRK